jgi:hypothetical protein
MVAGQTRRPLQQRHDRRAARRLGHENQLRRHGHHAWDPRSRESRQLCVVAGVADSLALGAGAVAWRQSSNRGDVGVYDFARGRTFAVCANGAAQADPVIAGRTVYWADRRSGRWELYGKAL